MKFFLTSFLVLTFLTLQGKELPEVVARFGSTELKRSLFQKFVLPASPVERSRTLKKLVDAEVYMLIIRGLLNRSGIYPSPRIAQRYIAVRRGQASGKFAAEFIKNLEQKTFQQDFQLKSALYFTFYAALPASVEPGAEEVKKHYLINQEKFQTQVQRNLALFKAGSNTTQGKIQAATILSRLKQGEDFQTLAKKFDPAGQKNTPAHRLFSQKHIAQIKELPAGAVVSIETPEGIFIVKMISRQESALIPFEETESYIREMLSSRKLQKTLEQYIREILSKTPVTYCFQVL